MKKSPCAIFLMLPLLFVSLTIRAATATVNNITYSYDASGTTASVAQSYSYSGTINIPSSVTISGKSYTVTGIDNGAFSGSNVSSVSIPSTVTKMGTYAFRNCSNLTSVTLGSGLTSIPEDAFNMCYNLTSVSIPSNVTSIGNNAFHSCTKLTSVTLPSGLKTIGSRAFYNAGLTYVTIPSGVTTLGDEAFYGTKLTSVTVPSSVADIGSQAFAYSKLTSVTIENGRLNTYVFSNCSDLRNVTIGANVTNYGSYSAFYGCSNIRAVVREGATTVPSNLFYSAGLVSVSLPSTLQSIGDNAFRSNPGLTTVNIPDNVKTIGTYAFQGCTGLTAVKLPKEGTSIGNYAFSGCTGLTSVTVPNKVTTIGSYAFNGCSAMTQAIIGRSVTSIGSSAFAGCTSLADVYFLGTTVPSITMGASGYAPLQSATVYAPLSGIDSYKGATIFANAWGEGTHNVYPMLEPGKEYRTFSYDRDLDFTTIAELSEPSKTLQANYVSAIDLDLRTVTFTPAGKLKTGEGVIIVGTGSADEYYPVRAATGDGILQDTYTDENPEGSTFTNYLRGNGDTPLSFEDKKPVDGTQRYFIMKGGDFYFCTGGVLAVYKSYLDLRQMVPVNSGISGEESKPFTFVYAEQPAEEPVVENPSEEITDGIARHRTVASETVYYTLDGRRVAGRPAWKGIYVCNGRKVVVR